MKTKKLLSLALSLVMIIASIALPVSAKTVGIAYDIQEDFSTNVLEGNIWTAFGTAGATTVADGALQVTADQSGAGITLDEPLPADQMVKLSFKMKFSATTAAGGIAITNNNKYNATTNPNGEYNYNTLFRVIVNGDGSVGYSTNYNSTDYYNGDFPLGGLAKGNITLNAWNDVDVLLDTHSNTFSLWVNDVCMVDRSTTSGLTVAYGQNPVFTGADKVDLFNAGVHNAGTGNVEFDDFEITRSVKDEIVSASYFFTDFDDLQGDAAYIKSYDCFDSMIMPWAIDRVNVGTASKPNYAMQIADRNNGIDGQLRMLFDEKVTTGVLTVEFDYNAANGVIPRLLFDQTGKTPGLRFHDIKNTPVLGPGNLDSGDADLDGANTFIGIKNSFVYNPAKGIFGYTDALYNQWVHVKYEYDVATGKSVVSYDDYVLKAEFDDAMTESFKKTGIYGIVFENSYGSAANYYWIDNLKVTNQGEGESSAALCSYDSNFANGTSYWAKVYGDASVVESDDNHGNSIWFRPVIGKNDENCWYYHEYPTPFTSGKFTWNFSACPVPAMTADDVLCRTQFAIYGEWGLSAAKASTVMFDRDSGKLSGAGSELVEGGLDFTYGEWYDITMTVDLDTTDTKNMTVTVMDANGDIIASRNDLVFPQDKITGVIVHGLYGDNGVYYDNHEISYEAPAPTVANINVYDISGEKVADIANIPSYADTIEVEFNTNVALEGLEDKIYVETNDDAFTKVDAKGTLLGNKYTLKLDEALAPGTDYCVVVEKGVKNTDGVASTSNSYTDICTSDAKLEATINSTSAESASAIIAGSKISVNFTAENTLGTQAYPYMIIAYRNGNKSVYVDLAKLNLTAADTGMVAGDITISRKVPSNVPAFDSVKVLLWDGLDTIKPIADEFIIQ